MRQWAGHIFATCVLIASGLSLQAQDPAAAPGTYQLMTINPKVPEVFTTDLRVFIGAHRALDHEVLLRIGQVTWVLIYSQAEIDAPGFQAADDMIVPVDPATLFNKPEIK